MKKVFLAYNPVSRLLRLSAFIGIVLLLKVNPASSQLISNVSASTGHPYATSILTPNVYIYTDRTYITTAFPSYLSNAPFIKTPNDDKASKSPVSFNLSQNAIVYIGYDPRATALPSWLTSWEKMPDSINITDPKITKFNIFRKLYPAGPVTIGGNVASPAANVLNMCIIVAVVNTAANIAPSANITSPANNASFKEKTTVTINAAASDVDGSIAKVDFYSGTTLLGTDNTSPFSFAWTNVVPGSYSLTAVATDNGNLTGTSAPVSVLVKVNNPPTVSLTSPAPNAGYVAPASVSLAASASDGDGSISKVEFYRGGSTLIGTDASSPYTFTWGNVAAGSYSITAKATDNNGMTTISTAVPITVAAVSNTPPTVSISKPGSDTTYTSVPATIQLGAVATAFSSTISKVEFYRGSTLIKTEGTPPYNCVLNNVGVGNYAFTAKAYDSKGRTATSLKRTISVVSNTHPSVVSVNPPDNATDISIDASISTNILDLPNGGIDNNTITSANVYLTEKATGATVPSNVNGTGGGDAITLVPSASLKMNTVYTFNITAGVKDLSATTFVPYTSTFTTSSATTGVTSIQFQKVALPGVVGRHTSVAMGPDGKLYALADDGLIRRFTIHADGTLAVPELLYALQDSYGTRKKTLAVGLAFDPSSTASNLIAWVTHCNNYVFTNAPDWDDRLTKLSGPNLQTVKDVLVNLPRSAKDHVSNSIAFGPDGALYFTQGASCAMGQADQTWNFRNEHLLTAALLRLDLTKLPATLPLDVKTTDGGGTYNPYAANAPLTIYASGIRNSYDLLWHSNGTLYAATNGSAAGGNTPSSVAGTLRPDGSTYNGPVIQGLTNVQQTQEDFLYRVVKGGYYGHPNATRGEYVMNGGNPTAAKDSSEVPAYPVGTMPDVNWRGAIFNFKTNTSPNGFIEYKSNSFGGALKGKLLVVRYSAHDDIITLTPGPSNNIVSSVQGLAIPGFSGFIDPLDLTEDVRNGNIYVSEYGGDSGKITLLKPASTSIRAARNSGVAVADNNKAVNTISGCDAGIEVVIAEDKSIPLLAIKKPRISPNPITTKFNIQFPNKYEGEYTLQIVDILGHVYQIGKVNLKGATNMGVDVSKLSLKAGTYFLKLNADNKKSEVYKLIIINN